MQDGVVATIDLNAVAHNYRLMKSHAGKAELACALKANAYGLGLDQVAKTVAAAGCNHFYTALFKESLALRKTLAAPGIATLHGIPDGAEEEALRHNITPVINEFFALERMRDFARRKEKIIPVILHVDTGMNRLGFSESEWQKLIEEPSLLEGLKVTYVMSHLACADIPGHALNEQQRERFTKASASFASSKKSFANTHGIFLGPEYHFDQCRVGRGLSGTPVEGASKPLKPALQIHAPILQVRRVDSDGTVGYGATQPVQKGARLATLSAGYADGLLRSLQSGKPAHVYLGGHPVPLVGRVSMDLIVIDVSSVPESLVHPGGEVELVGPHQTIDEFAEQAGTIGYELLTHIGARVERRYISLKRLS